jgi:signal transduction histidine kinase
VSAEAGHAVYRAVQESLTNAARYAPGADVSVELTWTETSLTTRIRDTGLPQGRSAVSGQGTGLGLAGMDERVRATGGSVEAGPSGGGWLVEVTVPAS